MSNETETGFEQEVSGATNADELDTAIETSIRPLSLDTDWNGYSESFQSVMPSEMLNLNRAVSEHMYGRVADFGCGAGKAIPFILERPEVSHYWGIDAAPEMVARARWMAAQFDRQRATLVEGLIEQVELQRIDSALSINSFYVWSQPEVTLRHIFKQLEPGGTFVLATINNDIDMRALLDAAAPEMVAHPHWPAFRAHNESICDSQGLNLVDLDTLVGLVRDTGFRVEEAHRRWYGRGLNYLVLEKGV